MKGQIIKKRCLKYRIVCIGLIIIVLMAHMSFRAKIVRASEGVTLDEYVLTLFASIGVGISDETILDAMTLYMNIDINSGSVSIQSAINQCESAVGSQFISNTFKSNNDSTQDYIEIVGEDNIDGVPDYSATASENISASIDNYNNFGFVSVAEGGKKLGLGTPLMKLAEIAKDVASIAWEKFYGWAGNLIAGGLGILDEDLAAKNGLGQGAYKWNSSNPGSSPYFYATRNVTGLIVGHYEDAEGPFIWIVNNTNERQNCYLYRRYGSASSNDYPWPGTILKSYASGHAPNGKAVWGGVHGDPNNYVWNNNAPIYSPDIITPDGNAVPGSHRPTYSHNSEKPYLRPIDINLYLIWAGEARQNTENGDTGESQGGDFLDLVIPYFSPQVDLDGIPQGNLNNPNPVYPAQPTYVPYPTSDPLASPTPATEVAPAPTLTPQELDQELEGKTIRNLGNVFPFCIPFDIVSLFKKMYVPRKAPVITWETNFGQFGSAGSITIDFSMFDGAASVCRTFELILFILGLMIATKNLIGWGG